MKIFISWSKNNSREIASELQKWLVGLFVGDVVEFFYSPEDIQSGEAWFQKIIEELNDCDIGIAVLTPQNLNSPWVMFEAGALSNKTMIPILFGRENEQIESPLRNLTYRKYIKDDFLKLLNTINNKLTDKTKCEKLSSIEVGNYVEKSWKSFSALVDPLVENAKLALPSKDWRGLKTMQQRGIDLSVQSVFNIRSDSKKLEKKPLLVQDIPSCLKRYVDENIENKYCIKDKENSDEIIFMINRTRVSTFFSFTDGNRIALFNRRADDVDIKTVDNMRFDVFGSIHFSNQKMLKLKITNEDFHNVSVKDIQEISGFAYEDNQSSELEKETVIMLGYSIQVKAEDLDKIKDKDKDKDMIVLRSLDKLKPKELTSKADLAYDFLLNNFVE